MRVAIVAAIALPALAGCARGFDERAARAEELERIPIAATYLEQRVYPAIGDDFSATMRRCLKVPGATTDRFRIVADITATGRMARVEVRPKAPTPDCVAAWLRTVHVPPPPKVHGGMVMTQDTTIVP